MQNRTTYQTSSHEETVRLAERLAQHIEDKLVIAFAGDLGAGKTAFVSGLAKGLGYTGQTCSPTFAIVNVYEGGRLPVYHFDMYRVSGWEDLETTGYFDALEQQAVVAVEWSENITAALPDDRVEITIEKGESESTRILHIQTFGGVRLADLGTGLRG